MPVQLPPRGALVAALVLAAATPAAASGFDVNHALGHTATQSSTAFGGDASRAIDGNPDGAWPDNSVTHTNLESQPYWQLDLGASYQVDSLELFNRTDCCRERLSNVYVFFANAPMTLRSATDTAAQAGVQTRQIPGQVADHQSIPFGATARYVRVQLAGDGYLSLAEVQALEHIDVQGPPRLATATSWVATGLYTGAPAFGLVTINGALTSVARGGDGRLHLGDNLATDLAIPGSPQVSGDAPAAVFDPITNRAFLAVRGADDLVYVAIGDAIAGSTARTWTWTGVTGTDAAPSLVIAGDKLVLAWHQIGAAWTNWIPTTGGSWLNRTSVGAAATPPALARNKRGDVAAGFTRADGSIGFAQATVDTALHWAAAQTITGWSNARIGVAAWGDQFLVSALGGDARPYVAVQLGNGTFNGFEPAWGATDVALGEAPTLTLFDGVIFVLARDTTGALRYWLRNPNTLSYRYPAGQMWLGGRIVGGWGVGATPPAVAALGASTVWGVWGSPAEAFVATRGVNDQQLYALNLGRFVALDVLASFGITLRGNDSLPMLDVRTVKNLFEHMVAFLALPGADAWTANARNPGCPAASAGVNVLLHPATAGQTRANQCPPVMFLNASYQHAFFMFHEWMHMDHARRGLTSYPDYAVTFGNSVPTLCQSDADCGGDTCTVPQDSLDQFDDPTIRRWDGQKMCVVTAENRPQGHATFYALQSDEHDFIEAAQLYRWSGRQLLAMAIRDVNHNNLRLWNMYWWFFNHYFDGIEYTGDDTITGDQTNRNLGWWGTPLVP